MGAPTDLPVLPPPFPHRRSSNLGPMLPETLSVHVCSLKQGEDRAALACHLQIAKDGQIKNWRFTRAKIRIAANIAYEDAQTAIDLVEQETQHGDLDEIIEVSSSP